uniref:RCC1-like domain-containing protein n=1 Tax=Chromera velia CCMP2878 TaxID=1169474 RepID=A0A0G4HZS4_9ALVE|eukprot:Cvel_9787.t1-p1 / transcript=Cvel_9787.t1 / gene=Cvel_9787 / organism=Chromera_velia_CCMP2878 / gene_product=Probable E3 ubiquitin-protein ligase HERC1, putative / transcript_product=Probable E3 ubiquitin-protein ligase HERC1, putative / location=Cvel_scaffold574:24613-29916(+) / protein_length=1026 / sequence_SO=supercontig / SO=protein_coding / is_pseudo=false
MVDDRGDLFGFGSNIHGQLGLEDRGNVRLPTRVASLSDVVDACAGGAYVWTGRQGVYPSFSLALLRNRTVISFGDNRYGQLGRVSGDQGGEDGEWKPLPAEELEGERVVGVACGGFHSAAWTDEGRLFMWGRGEKGQLGLGDTGNRQTASLLSPAVLDGEAVTQVALGGEHTLIVCRSGRLFSWGYNYFGQLGHGTSGSGSQMLTTPWGFLLRGAERVVGVAAGDAHSLVLTSFGRVLGFGRNFFGQLGLQRNHFFPTPQWVAVGVIEIAAGGRHSFVRVEDGRVFSFGRNEEGQLGLGHSSDQREPVEVEGVRAERLWKGGSLSDSSLLISEGGVVGAGKNREGQLGLGGGGGLSNLELSFEPLLATFECPPSVIHFQNDPGASFWRSSRDSFAHFFPFSSLDRKGNRRGGSASRIHTEFSPPVEPRIFDVGEPEKILVQVTDSMSPQNEVMCEFIVKINDTESPLLTCSPPLTLNVSRRMPPLTFPPPEAIRDNVDDPLNITLSYSHVNGSDAGPLFESADTNTQSVQVRVEGTDRAGNKGSCIIVVTADRCPSNSERDTADSACLCKENFYRSPPEEGFSCRPCDSNSQSKRGSTHSSDCLCNRGFYRDPSVPNTSICRQCIPNSHSSIGATHPSQCFCTKGHYFSPADTKNSEGRPVVSLLGIIIHNDPLSVFTSGTCEQCPIHAECSGEPLTDPQVSEVLRRSRLAKALAGRVAGRRKLQLESDSKCEAESKPVSPLRLLEAHSQDSSQQTLKQLIAHPRPVPHGNFSLVQRWPHAVVVPCPFEGSCSSVEPGQEDLADAVSLLQMHFQDETAGTVCNEGHEGPVCSECKKGRVLLRRGMEIQCHDCPPPRVRVWTALGLFLLMLALVLGYTFMVTKDNPKMDVPEHAVATKILTVFLTALGFLADLARPAFLVFRDELATWEIERKNGGWGLGAASSLARAAEDVLNFLRNIPTIGEVFSMKCLFDLFEWTTEEKHLAGRELLSLFVPVGVICLIGTIGLMVVLSSYCGDGKQKREGREG